jgi:translation elongation factor EF-G
MVEAAAESSEELMNRYLENGDLDEKDVILGLRTRTIAGEIHPMLCGTAFKNKGVQRMLDAVIDFLPSPVDIPPVTGSWRKRRAGRASRCGRREVFGARFQADVRQVRGAADLHSCVFGCAEVG